MTIARPALAGICLLCCVALCLGPSPRATRAAEPATATPDTDPRADGQPDEVDAAVDRAIAYMLKQQHDGGWINVDAHFETAITSLVVMAMASAGHQPTDATDEGLAMRRALAYVLREDRQQPDGYFGQTDASRMYGHGITTLLLTEMLGMGVDAEQDRVIREKCQRAIELILRAQKIKKNDRFAGGWRYLPDSVDADTSVTVWQVMALRSAHNAGITVPSEAIDAAVGYLQRSYLSPRDAEGKPTNLKSAFLYYPDPHGKEPVGAMPAAGLLAMQVCGRYDDPEVVGTADWLLEHPPRWGTYWGPVFYNVYYYHQGMYQRGGKYAETSRRVTEELLLKNQRPDGSWESPNESQSGTVYTTSLGVLSLTVKYHLLPIYQR